MEKKTIRNIVLAVLFCGVMFFAANYLRAKTGKQDPAQDSVQDPAQNAEIVSVNAPEVVDHNSSYDIDITVKNTGTEAWTEQDQYRLCVLQDGTDWGFRVTLPEDVTVEPGEEYTFTLSDFVLPEQDSTYLEFQMMQENVCYFGEKKRVDIQAEGGTAQDTDPNPAQNAEIVSENAPEVVDHTSSYNIDITVKNTGTEAWTEQDQYRLCIWQDGMDWGFRVTLPEDVTVEPGEEYTFTLSDFVLPEQDSTYLEFQMVQEGVCYFGEKKRADIRAE